MQSEAKLVWNWVLKKMVAHTIFSSLSMLLGR
jgi:hypothetical protein